MQIDFESDVPIYQQIAAQIEDGILSGAFAQESQVPSTTELSVAFQINPATVLKGITMLSDQGILYKKRGIGMFVSQGARELLLEKRRRAFYEAYILHLLREAERLEISREEILQMIERGYEHE